MEITLPLGINTLFAQATVGENGLLTLDKTSPLTLKPGTKVSLTISPVLPSSDSNVMPLRGTVTRYDDPFGSATDTEDWEAL